MSFGFPRAHLVAVALLCIGLWSFGLSDFDDDQQAPEVSTTGAAALAKVKSSGDIRPEYSIDSKVDGQALTKARPVQPETALKSSTRLGDDKQVASSPIPTIEHKIRRGDSLSAVFQRYGLSASLLHELATSKPHGARLRSILPGKTLAFTLNKEGSFQKLSYAISPLELLEFIREDGEITSRIERLTPAVNKVYRAGRINQSLFVSAQRSGLSDPLIMQLAQIFQWDIDFALDLRRGDEFSVILEELYLDGQFIGHRDILAAEFVNQGEVFRAVRFESELGDVGFYTPEGKSLRKAFLRAPLEFSRISSNFDLRRVHPLFNRLRPHRGIDYAAPTGTPVRASGSGRVQIVGKSPSNGNYIVLQHSAQYQTKYLHLSQFAKGLRSGSRVRQGDLIGYVGQTGWATGPHLHYEFLVNGVHQNPRTVKLPNDSPISGQDLVAFREHAKPLLFQLEAYRQGPQVAAAF